MLADKTHDGNALRAVIAEIGATAVVIPSNRIRRIIIPHDADVYKQCNRIERCFCRPWDDRDFAGVVRCEEVTNGLPRFSVMWT